MLEDRNRSSHAYNEEVADSIATSITTQYHGEFEQLRVKLQHYIDKGGE